MLSCTRRKAMAKTFNRLFADAQANDAYWGEWTIGDFADELVRRMELCNLSRSDLAKKLNVSPAYITKVLRGNGNFTVQSLVKLAKAVDSVIRVHLAPRGSYTLWFDVLDGANVNVVAAANKTAR